MEATQPDATPREPVADRAHDGALIAAAFSQIAERGWLRLSIPQAARVAEVPLEVARRRLPGRCALLLRFGEVADAHALAGAATDGAPRDRLFDLVMRRIDFFQAHRDGVVALLHALPTDPLAAAMLGAASLRSMRWLLEAAGIDAGGATGAVRAAGLLAVWGWTLRAWERDASEDLSATMAALDVALARAERAAGWLAARGGAAPDAEMPPVEGDFSMPPADAPPPETPPPPQTLPPPQQQGSDHGD